MNKEKTFGISHHDLFTGEPIDINELVLKVAQETGATQGSIVEAAPPPFCLQKWFAKMAMKKDTINTCN